MRVRERKQRQESEGLSATRAATATDLDPVMILIVRLLAAAAVADNRTLITNRALRQADLVVVSGPVAFELVRRARKWDKENRNSQGLCPISANLRSRFTVLARWSMIPLRSSCWMHHVYWLREEERDIYYLFCDSPAAYCGSAHSQR
jgi:hypothetical protein